MVRAESKAEQERGESLKLLIVDPTNDRFLGSLSLVDLRGADPTSAEIGLWTVAEERGRGIGGRAVRLFADWALAHLPLERIVGRTDPDNVASRTVMERLGFELSGPVGDRVADRVSASRGLKIEAGRLLGGMRALGRRTVPSLAAGLLIVAAVFASAASAAPLPSAGGGCDAGDDRGRRHHDPDQGPQEGRGGRGPRRACASPARVPTRWCSTPARSSPSSPLAREGTRAEAHRLTARMSKARVARPRPGPTNWKAHRWVGSNSKAAASSRSTRPARTGGSPTARSAPTSSAASARSRSTSRRKR